MNNHFLICLSYVKFIETKYVVSGFEKPPPLPGDATVQNGLKGTRREARRLAGDIMGTQVQKEQA